MAWAGQQLCGARSKRTGLPCRHVPVSGKQRCKWHGGYLTGGYRGGSVVPMRAAVVGKQALFRAMRLPWYGGRPPKNVGRVLRKMAKVLEVAEQVLEVLPADDTSVVPMPGGAEHAAILHVGSRDGLQLQWDTVKFAKRELERAEEARASDPAAPIDYKLLRLGNDAANQLSRLSVRVAEGMFRAKQDDVLVKLLERWADKPGEK